MCVVLCILYECIGVIVSGICLQVMFSDFGFSQSSFSGYEQGEYYRVQVRFFSGGITGDGFTFSLNLNLSGTASKYDIRPSILTSAILHLTTLYYIVCTACNIM